MCYYEKEVRSMDEERMESEIEETTGYVKRPWWQIALAWLGLGAFLVVLILYYTQIFRGGA